MLSCGVCPSVCLCATKRPVIRTASAKNRRFHVPQPTFVSPGDAPATTTQSVAWMERQFNACQTPRSMYLSIFNSFLVIQCLSQCVSPKIVIFPHFCFPGDAPGAITLNVGMEKLEWCGYPMVNKFRIYLHSF